MGAVDLRLLVEKSLREPLRLEDIEGLSISSRCELLARLLEKENKRPASHLYAPVESTTLKSIFTLNSNFEISEAFHGWQKKKRLRLVSEFKRRSNRPILVAYKNWSRITDATKQYALRASVALHRNVYMDGMFDRLPYRYIFKVGACRRVGADVILNIGGFEGEVRTSHAQINQYTDHPRFYDSAEEAFDTAHHEGTHLVQFHFALAYHRNQVPMAHPFFKEAAYFHSIDRRRAYVSSRTSQSAHWSQPYEVLARWEAAKISRAVKGLAL